jgi:nucleoside-diphosphate-sugar epimerase
VKQPQHSVVIFGASTDLGRRLAAKLTEAGFDVRRVSRSGTGDVRADLSTGLGVREAMRGADIVVSCAHAKFTDQILNLMPANIDRVILTGSAWRYSKVPNQRADQVRSAEASFLRSNRNGVMLHPTMIYGGAQENNIRRLLSAIRRFPIIPAPGGGGQIVQPIYIDDVVDCFYVAIAKTWEGPHGLAIAGPKLTWREMVECCAASIDCRKPIMGIPASPIIAGLSILNRIGVRRFDADMVRRFKEDVDVSISEMIANISVKPRDFESGIRQAVAGWRSDGTIYDRPARHAIAGQ